MDFEFGIIGDQLDLTDDEDLLSHVADQALEWELQKQSKAVFTPWKGGKEAQLQRFLKDLFDELQPRKDDYLARLDIVTRLSSALTYMDSFRGASISTFGSFESDLYTRWADLDLSLTLPSRGDLSGCISKQLKVKVLKSLLRTLPRQGGARNLQFIPFARVPLITFEDAFHNISCDISVENDLAIVKSRFLRWIVEIDSRCRDLIFLVKCWAKAHDINDPKKGTLNSYALCLLVIFHLQTRSPPLLPPLKAVLEEAMGNQIKGSGLENTSEEAMMACWKKIQSYVLQKFGTQNRSSIAELFVSFFDQFSAVEQLWDQGLAVCTFAGAWGDRGTTSAKWRTKFYSIAIEDPFDRKENCARSVRQTTCRYIFKAFSATADALSRPTPDGGLSKLLETLFLWPVDEQSMGLQAWLSKVNSQEGKTRTVLIGRNSMDRSIWVAHGSRGRRGMGERAKQHLDHHHDANQRAVSEYSLQAQHMQQIHLTDAVMPVVSGRTRRKLRYRAKRKEAASLAAAAAAGEPDAHDSVQKIMPGTEQALENVRDLSLDNLANEAKAKEMVDASKQGNRLMKTKQRYVPIGTSVDSRDEVQVKKPPWGRAAVFKERTSWTARPNAGVGLDMQNFPALQRGDIKEKYTAAKGFRKGPLAAAGCDSTQSSSGIQSHTVADVPNLSVSVWGSPEDKPSAEDISTTKQPSVRKHRNRQRHRYRARGSVHVMDDALISSSGDVGMGTDNVKIDMSKAGPHQQGESRSQNGPQQVWVHRSKGSKGTKASLLDV